MREKAIPEPTVPSVISEEKLLNPLMRVSKLQHIHMINVIQFGPKCMN